MRKPGFILASPVGIRSLGQYRQHVAASRIRHLTRTVRNLLSSHVMKVVRTIFAILIAVSVAVLPAAGVVAKSSAMSDMAAMDHQDMVAMDGMDCCPHQTSPSGKAMDESACMATCALHFFTSGGAAVSAIVFPTHHARLIWALSTNPFSSQTGSPPFRPPRV